MKKIKRDDEVIVIAGKDNGKRGKVNRVAKDGRLIISGINMIKRHTKPREMNQQGQIVEREAPIHVSNLQLICPECTQTGRVGRKLLDDGTKVRFCKKCGESIENK